MTTKKKEEPKAGNADLHVAVKSISNEDLATYPELRKQGYKLGDTVSAAEWIKIQAKKKDSDK